jgi:hypothetical protein
VPTQEREVLSVIDTFGFARVTNYGELFDVRIGQNSKLALIDHAFRVVPIDLILETILEIFVACSYRQLTLLLAC